MRSNRIATVLCFVAYAGCGGDSSEEEVQPTAEVEVSPDFVRVAVTPSPSDFGCPQPEPGLAVEQLALHGRTATVAAPPERPWTLPLLRRLLAHPLTAHCEADGAMQALTDDSVVDPATMIRAAAAWLQEPATFQVRYASTSLDDARRLLCGEAGCREEGTLPADLAAAIAPILIRAQRAVETEDDRRAHQGTRTASDWATFGGDGLLAAPNGAGFNINFAPDVGYLTASRAEQYEAAAALADAVVAIDWTIFEGRTGVDWSLETPRGTVRIVDATDHAHDFATAPLLLIDLGGNDTYLGRAGSSDADRPVAVVVDLSGADTHAYPEYDAADAEDRLPADADGRWTGDRFQDVSVSAASRQGGARTGVAMWFDLGTDDDVYVALRASQGYAHHGVGLLYDQGGNDRYRVEAAGQGTAQFGIGLLIDVGDGDDWYDAEHVAQGHGYTGGFGLLLDDGGNDVYLCRPEGLRYPAPQIAGRQVSLCQGAGFGFRDKSEVDAMPGGWGLLVDRAGDDRYLAGVYAQGVGLAEGVGVLIDVDGRDAYDAVWYGAGAGVHAGVGVLVDRGHAPDRYGAAGSGLNALLGVGHDRAVGVFVDDGGADEYRIASLSAGAATCGSAGIFIDEAGDDAYLGSAARALGHVDPTGCQTLGVGLMIDAGGHEVYPPEGPAGESLVWADGVGGLGVDAEGASGLCPADNSP